MISERKKVKFNARTIAYSSVLIVLLGVFSYSFISRNSIEATILRAPGMLFQEPEPGVISNLYNIKLVNKTNQDLPVEIRALSPSGEIQVIGNNIRVEKESIGESVFFLKLKKDELKSDKVPVKFGVYSDGELIDQVKSTFLGPPVP